MTDPNPPMPPFGGMGGPRLPDRLKVSETLRFAHVTDIHLSTERRCLPEDLEEDLSRILDAGDIDFIIASGDLTAGGKPEEFAAFRQVVDALPVPVFPAAGNHDDDSGVEATAYRQHLGPLYYSVDLADLLHLGVYDGEAWQREGLTAGANSEAFPWVPSSVDDWLAADLGRQPANHPILIVNHFPWGERMYRALHHHRILAVLSGHWHSSRRCVDTSGIVHYATPSLCFGGIDQTPRGYRHFTSADGRLQSRSLDLASQPVWSGAATTSSLDKTTAEVRSHVTIGPVSSASKTTPQPDGDWPQFSGGPEKASTANGPCPPLRVLWRACAGGSIHTASTTLHQGRIVQTTWDDDEGTGAGIAALDAAPGCGAITHPHPFATPPPATRGGSMP